jgi:hypothetical protein
MAAAGAARRGGGGGGWLLLLLLLPCQLQRCCCGAPRSAAAAGLQRPAGGSPCRCSASKALRQRGKESSASAFFCPMDLGQFHGAPDTAVELLLLLIVSTAFVMCCIKLDEHLVDDEQEMQHEKLAKEKRRWTADSDGDKED